MFVEIWGTGRNMLSMKAYIISYEKRLRTFFKTHHGDIWILHVNFAKEIHV